MDHQLRFTQEKLEKRLELLYQHRFLHVQPIDEFSCEILDSSRVVPTEDHSTHDSRYTVKPGQYWIGQRQNFLLTTQLKKPESPEDNLALYFPLGAMGDIFNHPEALIRVNGEIIGSADRYHQLIRLPDNLSEQGQLTISLQGWSGLTGWPIDQSGRTRLQMGQSALVQLHEPLEAFLSLASAALQSTRYLSGDRPEHGSMLDALDQAFRNVASDQVGSAGWLDSMPIALEVLEKGLSNAGNPMEVQLHAIGHAHLDIAYLWPIAQSRLKNAQTCSNQLELMERFGHYCFSHSQPALYAMLKEDYPDLFQRIKARIEEGRWELLGGMWVEADVNLAGPESLIRQFLLARQWSDEEAGGGDTRVLWLPDSFGFSWCLPQLARQAGIECIITNKLNWNQTNPVPASAHRWRGVDGSEIIMYVLTTPRAVEHLPFPTNYKSDLSAEEIAGTWTAARDRGSLRDWLVCYGYGDGGGGPTESLVRTVQCYGGMPGMPTVKYGTVNSFLKILQDKRGDMPVWDDEHYLEGHRGTYTSQAWLKRANRRMEFRLHQLEALAVMIGRRHTFRDMWQTLCLNQFHDILPGTSVPEAMDDARNDFAQLEATAEEVFDQIVGSQADKHSESAVISTAPYTMTRLVTLEKVPAINSSKSYPHQHLSDGRAVLPIVCPAYSITPLSDVQFDNVDLFRAISCCHSNDVFEISNEWFDIHINDAGQLVRLYDREQKREVVVPDSPANEFQVFEDRPLVWEAWDIEPYFEDRKTCLGNPCSIEISEQGDVMLELTVHRVFRQSTLNQKIRFYRHSRRIDFKTSIDWQEPHQLLKVCFPVEIRSRRALYDIQWGKIDRPTHRNTSWDQARFEVPAQKWACLQEQGYSVALLNDCKYGYDIENNRMRLTLIKTSTFPDPDADIGRHEFTYTLLAGEDDSQHQANKEAWDINTECLVAQMDITEMQLPKVSFVACDNPSIEIQTIKPTEDGNGYIVRFYECSGSHTTAVLTFASAPAIAERCDILEQKLDAVIVKNDQISIPVTPFEIVSVRCLSAVSSDG